MLALLFSWILVFSVNASVAETDTLRGVLILEIQNIEQAKGNIRVGIYNRAKGFPVSDDVYTGKVIPVVKTGSMRIEIKDLPLGSYAIGVHHDLHGHHKMPTNLFGVPLDPYGFSNDATAKWRAPRFEESMFNFSKSGQVEAIEIRYWEAW